MNNAARLKLFLMMVLELFIWGAWLPMIFGYLDYLKFDKIQSGWILNAFALGSFLAMFFSTQFADRNFAAEKFMALSHLIGGLAMLGLFWARDFWTFFALMLVHCLVYVPTLSIANSIAFTHLKDAQSEFGPVRMGGTVGWVLAAWPLFFIIGNKAGAEAQAIKNIGFLVAGVAELVLAGFSLALPHTPPRPAQTAAQKFAWLEALTLLKHPFILVLFLVTFVDACVHQCYFIWTESFLAQRVGFEQRWGMPIMSLGQIAEIGTMAVLGYFLKRLGWKTTMVLGILGHAVRFAVFAFFPSAKPLIVFIQVLHGICYAFFFATVYIFVDEFFPKDIRATAQGLFNFLIFGLGPFVGNFLWPKLGDVFKSDTGVDWQRVFLTPSITALAAAALLLLFFRPPAKAEQPTVLGAAAPAH
jgi:nucleoside transporter